MVPTFVPNLHQFNSILGKQHMGLLFKTRKASKNTEKHNAPGENPALV